MVKQNLPQNEWPDATPAPRLAEQGPDRPELDQVYPEHTDLEHAIRERAYAIWDQEDRPEGRHEAYWLMAGQEFFEPVRPLGGSGS